VAASAPVLSAARLASGIEPVAWKRVTGVQTGERPLIVWIADIHTSSAVERAAFDDESVRVASRAFRTVRIQPEMAKKDPYLAAYSKAAPTMVVFSPNLARGSATPGSALTAKSALDAMRASARVDEGMDLDAAVVKAKALMAEERSVATSKASLVRPADAPARAELDRRLTAIHTEIYAVLHPPLPVTR
jgi:hypothetical protein